ncbi:MAG TPA: bifunctional UDP-N-acetylglucosamine diphosphorylase/glucosamine-1-phosphate N-acetyltransferase GlmU [Fimbriimonadaceae bacterium]|nr:bifunctional UDP-N-acetylglucosamine diphosphorylase/glucosamine-1-phosphate N-acetyltransferase GlmU [Fimbriimonadaceae bacterium]
MTPPLAAIILAAGKGTRMKSDLPKGLHPVCGLPILEYIRRAVVGAGVETPVMVIGHGGDQVEKRFGTTCQYAWQREQKGTGHAVAQALPHLDGFTGDVLIVPGDTPLLESGALCELVQHHRSTGAAMTIASIVLQRPTGYGRLDRDSSGNVTRIVEEKDATESEKTIKEVGVSVYCIKGDLLREYLPKVSDDNAAREFYFTDLVKLLAHDAHKVQGKVFEDGDVFLGINDRWQLAEVGEILNQRILKQHALNGVTIVDPSSTRIGIDVQIGRDTMIEPTTHLLGTTQVGERCTLGPNTRIADSSIGDDCEVLMSHLNRAKMEAGARCGPFANLRPGAIIGKSAKVGNFVEVKNATLGERASVSHLSYIGDGTVGENANIGAGTIFCNYDGFRKHQTHVGARAFVGSNSTLVAPVTIGDEAIIAAGSVITHDVEADALGLGRARQENKQQWATQWRKRKSGDVEK